MISQNDYNVDLRGQKDLLAINYEEYYFNKMRPFLNDMLLKCKTDHELLRTIEKAMNAADSFCIAKDLDGLRDAFETLNIAITNKNYFNSVLMQKASEEEREMVRQLIDKIQDLWLIIKCEEKPAPKEKVIKDRLDYDSPNGENMGYSIHNMKNLTIPTPKKRIPNV